MLLIGGLSVKMSTLLRLGKKRGMGRKGVVLDAITILVTILSFVLTLVIAVVVFSSFRSAFLDTGLATAETNSSMVAFEAGFVSLDRLFFPLAVVGLIAGLIITSFLVPSHPIFIVVNVVGMFFLVFLATVFRHVYAEIVSTDVLANGTSILVYTPYVMEYLPWIGVVTVLVATIVGYSKRGDVY